MAGFRGEWRASHLFVLLPIALIVVISAIDLATDPKIHLGPLLVVAPAITPSFAGFRLTAFIGALAVIAQVIIAVFHGGLWTANHEAQIGALALVSAAIVFYSRVRDRHSEELLRVRSVSAAVQRVLMRPLPDRIGPLRVAALYLAADDEACVGGDLYAAVRGEGATRLVIGDVRGKGLDAISDAAALLGAFRELSHHFRDPGGLAGALERSYRRHLRELTEGGQDVSENFVTALVVDVPDGEGIVRMADCGHPPPLLRRDGKVTALAASRPGPPLGVAEPPSPAREKEEFRFERGDTLLLYTDGVTEARGPGAAFYPLEERVAAADAAGPEALLRHLRRDLLEHAGGRLHDDAAMIAIERLR